MQGGSKISSLNAEGTRNLMKKEETNGEEMTTGHITEEIDLRSTEGISETVDMIVLSKQGLMMVNFIQ